MKLDKLQEIKDRYMYWEYDFSLKKEDVNWLIEQAEKLDEIKSLINDERITKSETADKISKIVNE